MKFKGKVKAVSGPNKYEGTLQIGFTMDSDNGKWHNLSGEEGVLKSFLEKVIKKGSEIEFDEDEKKNITNLKLIKEAKNGNWADDMTNFEDLLSAAHKKFKDTLEIKTEMLQVDFKEKTAVFKATVVADQKVFEGHGDAEGITNDKITPHFMRMAETRAIARALRWATNNAAVAAEETSEGQKEPILPRVKNKGLKEGWNAKKKGEKNAKTQ